MTEVSVTPVPVHPGTGFAVVAGKALENTPAPAPEVHPEQMTLINPAQLEQLVEKLEALSPAANVAAVTT
jgi:hypothetical protein